MSVSLLSIVNGAIGAARAPIGRAPGGCQRQWQSPTCASETQGCHRTGRVPDRAVAEAESVEVFHLHWIHRVAGDDDREDGAGRTSAPERHTSSTHEATMGKEKIHVNLVGK